MNTSLIADLVLAVLGQPALSVEHMPFGHASLTYSVALETGKVIVRTNQDSHIFAKTEHNLAILDKLDLPVPRSLGSDLSQTTYPFAYLILEKIPGRDLRYELASMSHAQMTTLAEQIVSFQKAAATLPQGKGYGYVPIGDPGPFSSWEAVVKKECSPPTSWSAQFGQFQSYFATIQPVCFLDDLTVKNVIMQEGVLQGIVDFDTVCYGDPLFMLGLTACGIISDVGLAELFYVQELCRIWGLNATQMKVVDFYAALHAHSFLKRLINTETHEWQARMELQIRRWLA